jgi:muramoyltetrapeptide carboxypeptidase LdcA involved in peptidoglycan recycling
MNKNIMVISPSRSLKYICEENTDLARKKLESLRYKVIFSKNSYIKDEFLSSSISERIEDLHNAFSDNNVGIILTALGGYNANQLLDYIDYDLIKNNPKIICGYSDITVLLNAIYSMTGITTYLGPTFHSFAMKYGLEETIKSFQSIINKKKYKLIDPEIYSSDKWYDDQENRIFIKNAGMIVINHGKAIGKIIGGNLCSLNLLQGTKYMPSFKNKILFLEDDALIGSEFSYEFDRNLVSLMMQQNFDEIKGIIIGRTQSEANMTINKWRKILYKQILRKTPIMINANFGHTTPNATIPIGGNCSIDTFKKEILVWS